MTRIRNSAVNEYYHLYNRGAHRVSVFRDKSDYTKFLFSILYLQSPLSIANSRRTIKKFTSAYGFPFPLPEQEKIIAQRFVELVAFCIMPNHFHLMVREMEEGGISCYMQRVATSYTTYFNTRYETSGHVFQGRFKSVHVKDDRQLMHLSAYIHRNPRELAGWKGKEETYPYSSLSDYIDKNRWGNLLATDIVAGRFDAAPNSNYRDFVRTSPAKISQEEFDLPA